MSGEDDGELYSVISSADDTFVSACDSVLGDAAEGSIDESGIDADIEPRFPAITEPEGQLATLGEILVKA